MIHRWVIAENVPKKQFSVGLTYTTVSKFVTIVSKDMTISYLQGNAAAAQLGALNMNPAYRNLAPQQLTAAQQQQLLLQQGLNPSQV